MKKYESEGKKFQNPDALSRKRINNALHKLKIKENLKKKNTKLQKISKEERVQDLIFSLWQ